MKKGFITIAYGEYYYRLAENLLMSYRYNVPKEKQLPFAVITDKNSGRLKGFDDIIVAPPADKGFMNKLHFAKLSPYEEMIFIDADSLVYGDISIFFEEYEKNGYAFSSFGRNIEVEGVKEINNILFDVDKARKEYPEVNFVPHFNAATYYCRKNGGGVDVLLTAQELYAFKKDFGYPFWGDEPYVALAMAVHGCKCCDFEGSVYFGSHTKILKTDIINHTFTARTYGRITTAPMLHWSTFKTHHAKYKYEVKRLKNAIKGKKKTCVLRLPFYYVQWWTYKGITLLKAYYKALKRKMKKSSDS